MATQKEDEGKVDSVVSLAEQDLQQQEFHCFSCDASFDTKRKKRRHTLGVHSQKARLKMLAKYPTVSEQVTQPGKGGSEKKEDLDEEMDGVAKMASSSMDPPAPVQAINGNGTADQSELINESEATEHVPRDRPEVKRLNIEDPANFPTNFADYLNDTTDSEAAPVKAAPTTTELSAIPTSVITAMAYPAKKAKEEEEASQAVQTPSEQGNSRETPVKKTAAAATPTKATPTTTPKGKANNKVKKTEKAGNTTKEEKEQQQPQPKKAIEVTEISEKKLIQLDLSEEELKNLSGQTVKKGDKEFIIVVQGMKTGLCGKYWGDQYDLPSRRRSKQFYQPPEKGDTPTSRRSSVKTPTQAKKGGLEEEENDEDGEPGAKRKKF